MAIASVMKAASSRKNGKVTLASERQKIPKVTCAHRGTLRLLS